MTYTNTNKPLKKSLFIFRRDLRLDDNRALNLALSKSEQVVCLFVVDPAFYNKPALKAKALLLSALMHLHHQLQQMGAGLHIEFGRAEDVVLNFCVQQHIDGVFFNKEYTRLGMQRDAAIENNAATVASVYRCDDQLLFPPGMILTGSAEPYKVFTPFYNKARQYTVENVKPLAATNFYPLQASHELPISHLQQVWKVTDQPVDVPAMRSSVLDNISDLQEYEQQRNFPALDATSHLSVLLKFGLISVREAWWHIAKVLGSEHPLLRQLYWRDFFNHIAFYFPDASQRAFKEPYRYIRWANDTSKFALWCEGQTGFPLVDAGMRELNATGFMHNRVRMVVASFLVKDLHIDWRWGEKYFADKLLDYDSAVNNGNWQWAASTGCDSQPYFRIFNPWLQQEKFDKNCEYIKTWIPELRQLDNNTIHKWYKPAAATDLFQPSASVSSYPLPIVEHKVQTTAVKLMYKDSFLQAAAQPA